MITATLLLPAIHLLSYKDLTRLLTNDKSYVTPYLVCTAIWFLIFMDPTATTIRLRIQSSLGYTDLVEILTNNLTHLAACNSDLVYSFEMAVREIVINAMQHGNQLDPNKYVSMQYRFDSENFEVQVRDEGKGFDVERLPDPLDPENLLKPSGRGIFLVRSFMDNFSVTHNPDKGTEVRFDKRITSS